MPIDSESSLTNTENEGKITPEELEEVLDNIPEEHKKVIEKMMISSSMQIRGIIAPETEVMKKITPEHVSEYLSGAREEMQKGYEEKKQRKFFMFFSMLAIMIFIIVIIIILKDNPDVMEKVIYAAGGLIAGILGGYGIGKNNPLDN